MLSYQHIYHAGCLADVHKHAGLCALLTRMIQKENPMTYIETHAGRGLYDLNSPESKKTGEAKEGFLRLKSEKWLPEDHPYTNAISAFRKTHGDQIYAGSASLAQHILRKKDSMHLMELHPQEYAHLCDAMKNVRAQLRQRDGYEGLLSITPPMPRRGLVFIDPSFEIKNEYERIPSIIEKTLSKWNVAVICLWYPLLPAGLHKNMVERLSAMNMPKVCATEVEFNAPAQSRGMYGSGLFIINTPFGIEDEITDIAKRLHMVGAPKQA